MSAIATALAEKHHARRSIVEGGVRDLVTSLAARGLIEGHDPGAPHRVYELAGLRAAVVTSDAELLELLDRLRSGLAVRGTRAPDVVYEVDRTEDAIRVRSRGMVLREVTTPLEAATAIEWLIADEAAERDRDHIHVHGAVVAGPRASVLIPAGHRAGKTTLALAVTVLGMRLYADDLAFLDPRTWRPLPVPRSVHVEDDALARLRRVGFPDARGHRVGTYIESAFLAPWPRTAGPVVKHVVLLRIGRGPSSLGPAPAAEAAAELIGCSRNLQRRSRSGATVVRALFRRVRCWRLVIGEDLAAAAGLVAGLGRR